MNGLASCLAEVLKLWCYLTRTTGHWISSLSCAFCHVKSSMHPFCTRVLPHANNVIQASPRSDYWGQCTTFETTSSLWGKPRPPWRRRESEDKVTWRVGPSLRSLHIATWVMQNVKTAGGWAVTIIFPVFHPSLLTHFYARIAHTQIHQRRCRGELVGMHPHTWEVLL